MGICLCDICVSFRLSVYTLDSGLHPPGETPSFCETATEPPPQTPEPARVCWLTPKNSFFHMKWTQLDW